MNDKSLLKGTVAIMERFNFNKPVYVEIIYDDDNEGDTTEEIDVVNLSDHEQTVDNSSIEDSHETEASSTFRTSLNNNEDDSLQIVSQNMSSIVEAYLNYSYQYHKVNSKEANRLKSIYLKTKIYLFQQSFPMSLLLLRPEYRIEHFVQNFLKEVINKTRVKPDNINHILRIIFNDLIQWTEIKMGRKTFVAHERHKSYERLLFKSPLDLNNNNNQSYKERMLKVNDDLELITDNEETQLNPGISYSFNSIRNLISQSDVQNPRRSTNVNSQINHASPNNKLHSPVVIENNNSSSVLMQLVDLTNSNQENIQINNNNIQNINNNKIAGKTKSDIYSQKSQNSISRGSDCKTQIVENLSPKETLSSKQHFFALISHEVLNPEVSEMPIRLCHVCGKETKLICVACYKTYYCSGNCQSADWESHKSTCF